jgi:hypothetical protein
MSPVLSRSRSAQLRPSPQRYVPLVAIVVTVLVCLVISTKLEAPGTVSQITVTNATPWAAKVVVSSAPGESTVLVGTVEGKATRTFTGVLDRSNQWVLTFTYLNVTEQLTTTRADLAHNGWKVDVPANFGTRLQQEGIQPTPS